MAALVSMCQDHPFDESGQEILWIKRSENIVECSLHLEKIIHLEKLIHLEHVEKKETDDGIKRQFWIKAVIEKYHESHLDISVDYHVDMNLGLRYHYDGIKLITDSKLVIDSTTESECNFLAWVKYFETFDNFEKDDASKVVRFKYPRPSGATGATEVSGSSKPGGNFKNQFAGYSRFSYSETYATRSDKSKEIDFYVKADNMLKWGTNNLRKFNSDNFFLNSKKTEFRSSLFTTSPRDLSLSIWSVEDEKDFLTAAKINENDSEDTKEQKCLDFLIKEEKNFKLKNESMSDKKGRNNSIQLTQFGSTRIIQLTAEEEMDIKENTDDYKKKWRKNMTYDLSMPFKSKSRFDKIDYFISHSWADDAKSKCKGMEAFIERCNNSGKSSTSFWLDKVCIDQNDTTRGIETLPIKIGACKKILILMGKTYMTRLWCIW